jgi:hypothetical protein
MGQVFVAGSKLQKASTIVLKREFTAYGSVLSQGRRVAASQTQLSALFKSKLVSAACSGAIDRFVPRIFRPNT